MIKLNFKKGEEWYLEEEFEEIKEFRNTDFSTFLEEGQSDGCVGISVSEYLEEPQDFQQEALNYFDNNQKKVLNALCQGVIDYYPKLMEIYDYMESTEDYFPKISTPADVKKIIGISHIEILDDEKDGIGYIGFGCACPWDEEHGLGVIMHKDRVIDVGQYSYALSGTVEIRKDNGTYTEEERIRTEVRVIEHKKKWWQFWK